MRARTWRAIKRTTGCGVGVLDCQQILHTRIVIEVLVVVVVVVVAVAVALAVVVVVVVVVIVL